MNKKLGWQQWGAPTDDLWVSQPIVERIWQEYLETHIHNKKIALNAMLLDFKIRTKSA